jgi:cob(I)alamin adenosyltransferase
MKIYTKTGDDGHTGLIGGTRVWKNNPRIEAYGTVDELNSHIGTLWVLPAAEEARNFLKQIQFQLFTIGSNLATDLEATTLKAASVVSEADIQLLEAEIDRMDAELPPLKYFVLPGGTLATATAHVCRTVTRRAERRVLDLQASGLTIEPLIVKYLNRLSDYFFTLSRYLSVNEGVEEFYWKHDK